MLFITSIHQPCGTISCKDWKEILSILSFEHTNEEERYEEVDIVAVRKCTPYFTCEARGDA